ncbi:MAG TPA: Fis family transcriptional regulator, partial [Tistrella mobilis]|nr:Fis family transcriptional regulator [Tistrella mobilis]
GTNDIRPVDLRVIGATKVDLLQEAAEGRFRDDLYYRLNVVTIRIPPLRERRGDVPLLFAHFLERAAARFGRPVPAPDDAVHRHLAAHDWPGNVR